MKYGHKVTFTVIRKYRMYKKYFSQPLKQTERLQK